MPSRPLPVCLAKSAKLFSFQQLRTGSGSRSPGRAPVFLSLPESFFDSDMCPRPNTLNQPRNLPSPTQTHAPAEVKQTPVVYYTFLLIGLSLFVFVLRKLDSVLLPILFAALLSVLLLPLVTRLERWKMSRIWAIILALLLVIGTLVGLFYLFGSQIMSLREELRISRTSHTERHAEDVELKRMEAVVERIPAGDR